MVWPILFRTSEEAWEFLRENFRFEGIPKKKGFSKFSATVTTTMLPKKEEDK